MDHVFARVKRARKKPHFKLISDHTLFEDVAVNDANCVAYNPDHNLDEESWFKIENFRNHEYCPDFLKADFNSTDYDDLERGKFTDISYIFSVQSDDFYFQKISPSLFIRRKFIAFGEVATVEQAESRLVIKPLPDAIYLKNSNALVFRDLASIASIFAGIDVLYKEATNDEVQAFLSEPFISLDNFTVENVSKPNRKRIALAMTTLGQMDDNDKHSLFAYIHDYCENNLVFNQESGKFTISKDEELKQLVYGIEQRFYTTQISREKRLANSIITL